MKAVKQLCNLLKDKVNYVSWPGESQWTYREDLKNEDQLWDNFFDAPSRKNNVAVLRTIPLTDQEDARSRITNLSAGLWKPPRLLAASPRGPREDASLGTIRLACHSAGQYGWWVTKRSIKSNATIRPNPPDRDGSSDQWSALHIKPQEPSGFSRCLSSDQKVRPWRQAWGIYWVMMFVVTNKVHTRYIARSSWAKATSNSDQVGGQGWPVKRRTKN